VEDFAVNESLSVCEDLIVGEVSVENDDFSITKILLIMNMIVIGRQICRCIEWLDHDLEVEIGIEAS